jgi:hypothetical protein
MSDPKFKVDNSGGEEYKGLKEDAPANAVGGGNIAGVGVGPQGEPGFKKKKSKVLKRFSKFIISGVDR